MLMVIGSGYNLFFFLSSWMSTHGMVITIINDDDDHHHFESIFMTNSRWNVCNDDDDHHHHRIHYQFQTFV